MLETYEKSIELSMTAGTEPIADHAIAHMHAYQTQNLMDAFDRKPDITLWDIEQIAPDLDLGEIRFARTTVPPPPEGIARSGDIFVS
jgi:hypothetical protein